MKEQEVAEAKPEEQEITESKAEQKPKVPSPQYTACPLDPPHPPPDRSFPMSFSTIHRTLFATSYSAIFLTPGLPLPQLAPASHLRPFEPNLAI